MRKIVLGLRNELNQEPNDRKFKVSVQVISNETQSLIETKLKKYPFTSSSKDESFLTATLDLSIRTKNLRYRYICEDLETGELIPDRKIRKFSFEKPFYSSQNFIHRVHKTKFCKLDLNFESKIDLNKITDDLFVGACPICPQDVDHLLQNGISSVLNLQTK